ncbi:nucleotidyltransferase domain-containing protein [Candidatus Pacearchaeota archaeon]|nr:nucleotidyltransferase domain-containing protein [Candidatus Pacearchaeota archaeon]
MLHMEQKDYKLEIVIELLKNESHAREIAKKLNINHMNIIRKMRELSKENAVDYNLRGKNKVYFLKKNSEAKALVFMAENYKLIKILEKYAILRNVIESIQKNKEIKMAILFGSYAKRIAKQDSDIDVYIETVSNKIKSEIEKINTKLSIKIGRYNKSSLLIKEIDKNHIIIKGIEQYYEKSRFFN